MIKGDTRARKFDRSLLDEATHRELLQWALILHLDPDRLREGDRFADWAERCGVDLRPMDEGGAVARPEGGESFLYISPAQYEAMEAEMTTLRERK